MEVVEEKKPLIVQNVERLGKYFGVKTVLKDGGCEGRQSLCLELLSSSGDQGALDKATVSLDVTVWSARRKKLPFSPELYDSSQCWFQLVGEV